MASRASRHRPFGGAVHDPITLAGGPLTCEDVEAIARGSSIALDAGALERVEASHRALSALIDAGERIYGVTTGLGALVSTPVRHEEAARTQLDLLRSHAAGAGEELPREAVRAALAVRLNGLLRAHSGIRPLPLEMIAALLNADVIPVIPRTGSLGASGDLAPSAHAFLVLVGEGSARDRQGELLDGATALARCGHSPIELAPKEGLALTNGTHFMAGLGAQTLAAAARLAEASDLIAAVTIEALGGVAAAFDADLNALRPLDGQQRSASVVRDALAASTRTRSADAGALQDAYSLRCVPQVHGAAREAVGFARRLIEVDLDAVTDNPVLVGDPARIVSGGNFHGQSLALGLDTLRLSLADLGAISERRTFRLVSPSLNGVLPAFLTLDPGSSSGLMIAQYTAAALVAELRALAHPVSTDTIPTSDGQEDHVSMGMTGAVMAADAIDRLRQVLAIELLCACQAIELGGGSVAPPIVSILSAVRERVPPLTEDRPPAPDIARLAGLVEELPAIATLEASS